MHMRIRRRRERALERLLAKTPKSAIDGMLYPFRRGERPDTTEKSKNKTERHERAAWNAHRLGQILGVAV